MASPPTPVAWDEPIVRKALRAHARRARNLTMAGIAVCAVVAVAFIGLDRRDDAQLRRTVETTATVTDGRLGSSSRVTPSSAYIDVTYAANGVDRTARLVGEAFDEHPVGSKIDILYDPDDPGSIRTASNPNRSIVTAALLVVATFVAALTLLAGLRTAQASFRWRRWLRSRPAHEVTVTEGSLRRGTRGGAWLLRISSPNHHDVAARLTGMQRWLDGGLKWFGGAPRGFDGSAIVCSGSGRKLVVIDPDVEIPVQVALARDAATAQRWLNWF